MAEKLGQVRLWFSYSIVFFPKKVVCAFFNLIARYSQGEIYGQKYGLPAGIDLKCLG